MKDDIVLLPHNEEAYDKLVNCLEKNQLVTIDHATGTGKSFITLKYLAENKDKRILYLAPTYPILHQLTNEHMQELGIDINSFKCFDTNIYRNLLSLDMKELVNKYDVIIMDEYHRCGALKWGKKARELINIIKSNYNDKKVIGLTATEIRYLDNSRNMNDILFDGVCASKISLADAILKGILPVPVYYNSVHELLSELDSLERQVASKIIFKDERRGYYEAINAAREEIYEILRNQENYSELLGENGKFLVFSSTVDNIKNDKEFIKGLFKKKIDNEYVVTSRETREKNKDSLDKFRSISNKFISVLYSINILNEGVHVKDVDAIFMRRKTTSPIIYFQQLGRLLSYSRRKDKVYVFDLCNNIRRHKVIYKLYDEVIERAHELINTDPDNKERYQYIINNFKIFDATSKVYNLIDKLSEKLREENIIVDRLRSSIEILNGTVHVNDSRRILAHINIFKYQNYIDLDLFRRIKQLKVDKPPLMDLTEEEFLKLLGKDKNLKELLSSRCTKLYNDIINFYDTEYRLPTIFSEDEEEAKLASKLFNNVDFLGSTMLRKIAVLADDELSTLEQIAYGVVDCESNYELLNDEVRKAIDLKLKFGNNVMEYLSSSKNSECNELINIIDKNNLYQFDSKYLDVFDDEIVDAKNKKIKKLFEADGNILFNEEFLKMSLECINELENANLEKEYVLNFKDEIIEFMLDKGRNLKFYTNDLVEKELFVKRIIFKDLLEKYDCLSELNEASIDMKEKSIRRRTAVVYEDLINFMNEHGGGFPYYASTSVDEQNLSRTTKQYDQYFTDEEKQNILEIQKLNLHQHLIIVRNYINFIKKNKRRPMVNSKNEYEIKLFYDFKRQEPFLTEVEEEAIKKVVNDLNKVEEARNVYLEILKKKEKK